MFLPTAAQLVTLGLTLSLLGGAGFSLGALFVVLSTLRDQVTTATRVGMGSMRLGLVVLFLGLGLAVASAPPVADSPTATPDLTVVHIAGATIG